MRTERNSADFLQMPPRVVDENEPVTSALAPAAVYRAVIPDPTPEQYLRALETSGTVDFWNRPEEDLYTSSDGEPV